jgi:hypothetical protein
MAQNTGKRGETQSKDDLRGAAAERDRMRGPERGQAIIDYLLENAGDDVVSGLEAVLIGSPDTMGADAKGAAPFWSVKARQLDLLSLLLNRFIGELEKNDLYALWTSGGPDFDRDVVRALWHLGASDSSAELREELPAQAIAMAKLIHRFTDIARKAQNAEGGYHHSYPGALISRSHDGLKLRRAGKAEWIAFIRPLLDERVFEGTDPDELLDVAWEAFDLNLDPELHLIFKDADSWTEYNARFGLGSLRDAVVAALERSARRSGIWAVLGTQPKDMLQGVLHAIEEGAGRPVDPEAQVRLQAMLATLAPVWQLGSIDGEAERDVASEAREELIALGEALFPEPEDMPALGKVVPYQGTTLFEAIDAELAAFASGGGVADPDRRADFTLAIAVFAEAFNAALADRFVAFDSPPGRAVELLRQFLKLNVTYWWSELLRRAALTSLSAFLGETLQKSFTDIDPAFAATLSHYGIGAARWDAIRTATGFESQPLDAASSAAREPLDAWLWDRLILVALPGDEPAHARFIRGAADFTAEGELLRFLAQFRGPRAPFLPKPHGTVEAREADQKMYLAMASGDGLPALTNLLIWTVLFARLTRFGFDMAEGKAPPIGRDEWPWFNAALAAGALGFCADLLFGDTTGMKVVPLSAFATLDHPAIGPALRIWRRARHGEDVRAALATWAEREGDSGSLDTLQVTRQALNYALLHQLQDMMSPGYLPRTTKEMQARAAESYWRMPGARDSSDGGGFAN